MNRVVIPLLTLALALGFVICVFAQIVIVPGLIADEAVHDPLVAYFRMPFTVIGVLGIACFQVVLVSTAMLLTKAWGDAIFSRRAFPWVDAVIGAVVVAAAMSFAVSAMQLTVPAYVDPEGMGPLGLMLAGGAGAALGVCAALVLLVMRGLLRRAMLLQEEMAQVV